MVSGGPKGYPFFALLHSIIHSTAHFYTDTAQLIPPFFIWSFLPLSLVTCLFFTLTASLPPYRFIPVIISNNYQLYLASSSHFHSPRSHNPSHLTRLHQCHFYKPLDYSFWLLSPKAPLSPLSFAGTPPAYNTAILRLAAIVRAHAEGSHLQIRYIVRQLFTIQL